MTNSGAARGPDQNLKGSIAMFFTYLRRELRRRRRQAIVIALGLALGVGLVITVAAASAGVKDSQATVLHSLYGLGTDLTVTQAPAQGQSAATVFGFRQDIQEARRGQIAAGTKIDLNNLANSEYGTLSASSVAAIARQHDVTGAAGALALTDATVTGTVPSLSAGSGSFASSFTTNSFTVAGVDPAENGLGPFSSATLTSGRILAAADAHADDAVLDAGYAAQNKLTKGDKVNVGGTSFTVVGLIRVPGGGSPTDVYIPLARAQAIGKTGSTALAGKVNTVYVTAASAADIPTVQNEIAQALPGATITDQNNLANEVTGSLSSTANLANDLGTWLSVVVLIAAFTVASLLTMAAVTRRVREFGTLKALGWRSSRIVGQVMGESITIGILGGAAGIALGYAGATLIDHLAPKLSATIGAASAASVGGGALGGKATGALKALGNTPHTVSVALTAPVTVSVILLAVGLAVAGGLIAGALGGWRAARLRPAAALTRVE
jgi:putative ABC transport system permease protein